ncbi:O-antigen ligase family protein [Komarekiella sp. 'clone 1']|uniref:O-antigen ligase family protein n=1 Tax=Komarekiella delphini-convector SJRDD-AB1 TaxID=2593771 RepID=A0AA40SWI7_9NOST|nr:O-antigen ligase family protein [Komarekiella delphini-convector]MBD6616506.1 O-antigen ligase family protein [Komarekiella delphini-convector SJRDD-AB1]
MLGASLNKAFYHPDPSLQSSWNLTQLGLLVFPLSPFLGAVGLGFAVLLTWLQQSSIINRRPLNWGFALLSVLLIITAGFANNKTEAFLGLFNFLPFFLVFVGLSALIQTPAQLRQMAWILVIGSLPVAIMGLGQLFLGWTLQLQFLWIVLEWAIAPGGEPPGRMASIFMHANSFAAYLVIVFTLGLGLWLENYQQLRVKSQGLRGRGAEVRRGRGERLTATSPLLPCSLAPTPPLLHSLPLPLLFLTVAEITNFIALIFTNSRNGWAIAIFACLAYAFYQGWRILVGSVVGIVTSVLFAAFAPSPVAQFFRQIVPAFFWARLNDDMYPNRPVALMRKTQWEFAWSLTQQHPWTGWGLRSFTTLYKTQMQIRLGHPHNLFLMLSAETGFPSTFLFCGLLGWILIAGFQLLRKSKYIEKDRLIFFSYLLVFVGWLLFNTVDITLFDFRLNLLSWLLLAAICGVVYHYDDDKLVAH